MKVRTQIEQKNWFEIPFEFCRQTWHAKHRATSFQWKKHVYSFSRFVKIHLLNRRRQRQTDNDKRHIGIAEFWYAAATNFSELLAKCWLRAWLLMVMLWTVAGPVEIICCARLRRRGEDESVQMYGGRAAFRRDEVQAETERGAGRGWRNCRYSNRR